MRNKRHNALEVEMGELNLVPYMDIMVNLIMFMLVSTTSLIQMKVINVSVPAQAGAAEAGAEDKDKLLPIVLGIVKSTRPDVKSGFLLSVDGLMWPTTPSGQPTLPVLSTGEYDFKGLTALMEQVKAKSPNTTSLTLQADATVDYETVVKTMDAVRRDSKNGAMFDGVLLGVQ